MVVAVAGAQSSKSERFRGFGERPWSWPGAILTVPRAESRCVVGGGDEACRGGRRAGRRVSRSPRDSKSRPRLRKIELPPRRPPPRWPLAQLRPPCAHRFIGRPPGQVHWRKASASGLGRETGPAGSRSPLVSLSRLRLHLPDKLGT